VILLALALVALILAIIDEIQAGGKALLPYAVICLAAIHLIGGRL